MTVFLAILCAASALLVSCDRHNVCNHVSCRSESAHLIIDEWEPVTILKGITGGLNVQVAPCDSILRPSAIANEREYFALLAKISYLIRTGEKLEYDSIDQRQHGVWRIDTLSVLPVEGRIYCFAVVYLRRDSIVYYPAIVFVDRTGGYARIDMDAVGIVGLRRQDRFTPCMTMLGSTEYAASDAKFQALDTIADSLAAEYYRYRKLSEWVVY